MYSIQVERFDMLFVEDEKGNYNEIILFFCFFSVSVSWWYNSCIKETCKRVIKV